MFVVDLLPMGEIKMYIYIYYIYIYIYIYIYMEVAKAFYGNNAASSTVSR